MNALLDPICFDPPMAEPDITTLNIRIDSALMRALEAGAVDSGLTLDEHVAWLIKEAVFINSPAFFDPDNEEAHEYRMIRETLESSARGEDLPLDQVMKAIEDELGADGSGESPTQA